MKTIQINNRANLLKVLGVVGALTAIYFYRRRGGSMQGLIDQGKGLAGRVREQATEAFNNITDSASEASETVAKAKSNIKDVTQHAKSRLQTETSSVH